MDVQLSEAEILFVEHGIFENLRNDGRLNDEYRPLLLETGVVDSAYGSARIRLGNTDVLVGIKGEIETPLPSAPDCGRLQFFVDCSANATPDFEGRGGNQLAEDIAVTLSSAYANEISVDLRRLCLIPGKSCWLLYVDVVILEYGGNPYDAVGLAVKAALADVQIPNTRLTPDDMGEVDIEVPDDPFDCWQLDVTSSPLLITVGKVGLGNVVDLTLEEEICCKSNLIVGVSGPTNSETNASFVTLMKQIRGGSLDPDSIGEMLTISVNVAAKLHESLLKQLAVEKASRKKRSAGFLAATW